jgi:fatty-acyl-CoA synthase
MMVNSAKAHALDQPVTVSMGGSPPSPTLLAQMKKLNFQPIHLYGLTETYGPITICTWPDEWNALPAEEQARLRARQGQGYITAEDVRVVDENSHDVPRNGQTIGEVAMRGNTIMKGYYQQPEATAQAFRDGLFHSGDLAVWHPDGYIELRDRQKDIIISGGENISTIEVEQTIVRHSAVLECAVVSMPHEKWGERPKAFIALKEGQELTEAEIIAFCRDRLAHFKCPDAVEFGELPKTSTGKVQKFVLRELEWAGHKQRIN